MNEIACLTMLLLDNLNRSEGQESNEPDRIVPGIPVRSWCGTVENTDSGNSANRAVDIPDGATIYYLHPKTG
jgi:hypothetical protein